MAELIVDLFQSVEIQQQKREFTSAASGPADLRVQCLKEAAMISQTGEKIARGLVAKLVLDRSLFCNVNGNDFVAGKVLMVVIEATATQPDSQRGPVLSFPFCFDRMDPLCLAGSHTGGRARAKPGNDFKLLIRRKQLFLG